MQLDDYSNKNLQDAPRMKAQLKGCHLPSDVDNQPDSLAELIRRAVSQVVLALLVATAHKYALQTVLHWKPPACVVTCIFLLFNEWTVRLRHAINGNCFAPTDHLECSASLRNTARKVSSWQTCFTPESKLGCRLCVTLVKHADNSGVRSSATNTIPSEQRAQSFLYLVHRFLETPELVASDFANGEAKLPPDQLLELTRRDCSDENQDTDEELEFARKMQAFREDFMEKYKAEELANVALSASGKLASLVDTREKLAVFVT